MSELQPPTPAQLRHAREDLAYRAPETLSVGEKRLLDLAYPSAVESTPSRSQPTPAPDYTSDLGAEEPEPCGCEESVALKAQLIHTSDLLRQANDLLAAQQTSTLAAETRVEELEAEVGQLNAGYSGYSLKAETRIAELEAQCNDLARRVVDGKCTPAERRVLKAMARIPSDSMSWFDGISVLLDEAILAELARRAEVR